MDKCTGLLKNTFVLMIVVATAVPLFAQTFTTIADFTQQSGGNASYGPLVQGLNGNLYGTTQDGGVSTKCHALYGCGTIFEVSRAGVITTLYNFCSQTNCTDGKTPEAGLTLGVDGNFYGTTTLGGATGKGTIFRITPSGIFSTLHNFCSLPKCADGLGPIGNLVQGINGNFFGVTGAGGNTTICLPGCGSIYEISPAGNFSTFFAFCSTRPCPEGAGPSAGLVVGSTGAFYGTTLAKGGNSREGTVFRITPSAQITVIHDFYSLAGGADGWDAVAAMTLATNGNLYGSTESGGAFGNGSVFQVTPAGLFSTVYSFCPVKNGSYCPDGSAPLSALAQGTDGNLYGTTWAGGAMQDGNAFQLTTSGMAANLYSFCSQFHCSDGALPNAGLMQSTDGALYGLTDVAGADQTHCHNGCGTVYSLSMDLDPFVKTLPPFGRAGYHIKILGNGLKAATGVTFNGAPATFNAVSNSYIVATVPSGATSGTVEVTTPSGTLKSNMPFYVP